MLTFDQLIHSSLDFRAVSLLKRKMVWLLIRVLSVILLVAYEHFLTAPWAFPQISAVDPNFQTLDNDKTYRLIWSDEFDKDGSPDTEKWDFERGFVRNEELQWYQPENATCEGGLLVIQARRERVRNSGFNSKGKSWEQNRHFAHYTSACLTTRGLHSWKYVRIEVRARIDVSDGLWPAIWTVGENGEWPDSGEIDIMEYYKGHILANACWSSGVRWKPLWDSAKQPLSELGDTDWASQFHTWRMDWDEQRIELFVDERLLNRIELNQTVATENQRIGPFHRPHFLLLNLAVGGTNGGDPSGTAFPRRFEVDYVRVYEQ